MSSKYLLLWLEAPLQSWGADSKFGRRDTLKFPTKSGVLGLLCCALGARGEQKELLESMAGLRQSVISYVRTRKSAKSEITEPVKAEKEPLLRDFHMVGSGYDDTDLWAKLLIPKTIEGKPAVGGGSKMTYRYYLQDSQFAVVLEVPSEKGEIFSIALQNPVYDLYLGRKNCVPTDFIFRGVFDQENDAMDQARSLASEKKLLEDFRVLDGELEGETFSINDVPVQFGEKKKYRDRMVTLILAND